MAVSSFVSGVFLASVLFIGYFECYAQLTEFGKQAQSILPKKTYEEVFAVNIESNDKLKEAVQKATDKFDDILGSDIDESLQQQLVETTSSLKDTLSNEFFFEIYANTIGKLAEDNGVLTSDNMKELAQKWVDELNTSAKSLKSTDFTSTLPALTAANARFLKSLGLTSTENVNQFAKILIKQANNF